MTFIYNRLVIAFCIICAGCASAKLNTAIPDTLSATALQPVGRTVINDDQNLELISSAAHVGFSFQGKECQVFASIPAVGGHNYLQYELDGVYQKRIKIEGNAATPITLTATTEGAHTIWIYKATEAHTGAIVIQKVTGKDIKALQKPEVPLIEFIGNSITCGAAADPSEVPCGTGVYHDQHNAYYA